MALAALAAWGLLRNPRPQEAGTAAGDVRNAKVARPSGAPAAVGSPAFGAAASATAGGGAGAPSLVGRIQAVLQALPGSAETAAQRLLEQLQAELRAADPALAARSIAEFLATGADASTGLGFQVGPGGILEEAPSLRVFLMDQLAAIDPETALRIARETLTRKESADEWAVALRNVAWFDKTSAPFLASKVTELLRHQPWREQPTAGFLEAFDVAVFTRATHLLPDLAGMLTGPDPSLRRAATVALTRLAVDAPLEVMTYLNNSPALLADRPFVRADYYTHADLGQPAQRQAVETYLERADVTVQEKVKFLHGLVAPGFMVSDNLLTVQYDETDAQAVAREQVIAEVVRQWRAANRYPDLSEALDRLLERLAEPRD